MNKHVAGKKRTKRTMRKGGRRGGLIETAAVPFGIIALKHLFTKKKRNNKKKTMKKKKNNKKRKV